MSNNNKKHEDSIDKIKDKIMQKFDLKKEIFFDYCICNPPYQITKKDTSDKSIYHNFIDIGRSISKESIMITPARFLFDSGNTPHDWNKKILNDKEFEVLFFEPKSTNIFPTADIKGGVCITRCKRGNTNGGYNGLYVHFKELRSIKQKISLLREKTIDSICFPQTKFNLENLYKEFPEYKELIGSEGKEKRLTSNIFSLLPKVFSNNEDQNSIGIWGLENKNDQNEAKSRTIKYINKKFIDLDLKNNNIQKFKVIVPASNGSGSLGEVLSTPMIGNPMIGNPMIGNTQTFISFGSFNNKAESENCLKYIKTRFCRAILGILKVTQSNKKEVWKFVPIQNFTNNSDINWNQDISEIDEQLFKKYKLDQREISFIKEKIKEMK